MPTEAELLLRGASPSVRQLALRARTLIKSTLPDVVETPWPKDHAFGYGTGPNKWTEVYGWLGVYTAHVTLGFYYGVDLPDPQGLLKGEGKRLRNIKITDAKQLDDPALRALLKAAWKQVPRPQAKVK